MNTLLAALYGLLPGRYRKIVVTGSGLIVLVASEFTVPKSWQHWEVPVVAALTLVAHYTVPNDPTLKAGTHTVYRRYIPTTLIVPGKPIGRHVHWDSRSLNYLVKPRCRLRRMTAALWQRVIAVLDQGDVGACTGNAATGNVGTQPLYSSLAVKLAAGLTLNEAEALKLYSAAEVIDGDGPYPPNDNGSSGLSVAKAALAAGLISGYQHITSIAAAKTAILTGPFIIGSDWYTSFDTPDANGLVAIAKGATVRGGHEYECIGYDPATDLWHLVNSWGTSYGVAGHFYYSSATFSKLLASDGDATVFVPLTSPAPTPTPVPATGIVLSDPALVEHIDVLAAKAGETPEAFLAARLHKLYPTAK